MKPFLFVTACWCNVQRTVDRGFESVCVKPKTNKICIFVTSLQKQAALKSKNKDWLAWNQNNVYEPSSKLD